MLEVAQLTAFAREARFDLVGFARAEPIPRQTLTAWLEAGFDADMDWMGRRTEERLDVEKLLPGAKTVLSFACCYRVEDAASVHSPIAIYARGRDYHATMRDRLRAFRRMLSDAHPNVQSYGGIDSGPMMEKVWAARAGIGYVARSGCLMTEEFGSYVVLATLILDDEVDRYADGPTPDRCGACTICISDCPTGAIDDERRVDARRCLSYQTIENEGPVPSLLRGAFENIVFGCDICQTVCPLNRKATASQDPRFLPRAVASLSTREIAALSKEKYQELVPGSALARAGYDGLRRNAAYALGAVQDRGAKDLLEKLRHDENATVREAAEWALARL